MGGAVAFALLLSLCAPGLADASESKPETIAAAIADLRAGEAGVEGLAFHVNMAALAEFYADRGDRPVWLTGNGEKARTLVAALRGASRDGLRPAAYRPDELVREMETATGPEAKAALELRLSGALLSYARDLRHGRLGSEEVPPTLSGTTRPRIWEPLALLRDAAAAEDLGAFLDQLAPATPVYRRLRRALSEYQEIESAGGWPTLAGEQLLRRGMEGPDVAALRQRLKAGGDLTVDDSEPTLFDAGLEQAVRRFQRRHGLEPDGVVGPKTYHALNVPVATRIRQIEVNLERWRWMPDDLGGRYVLVNLAGYEVDLVEAGAVQLHMRAVVGKPYRKTPVFSDSMTYLDFNPTWTVPPSILRKDIIPKLRQNPDYLAEQNMKLYAGWDAEAPVLDPKTIDWASVNPNRLPYRVVQAPGPQNALGRVKFMFPNRHHVYLHDTPSPELFDHAARSFSSGCIRVAKPLELAEQLLANKPGWDRAKIEAVIASGKLTRVLLPEPVPVHLTYTTAWIGEGGTVHFREDIYGRDLVLAQALEARRTD